MALLFRFTMNIDCSSQEGGNQNFCEYFVSLALAARHGFRSSDVRDLDLGSVPHAKLEGTAFFPVGGLDDDVGFQILSAFKAAGHLRRFGIRTVINMAWQHESRHNLGQPACAPPDSAMKDHYSLRGPDNAIIWVRMQKYMDTSKIKRAANTTADPKQCDNISDGRAWRNVQSARGRSI